MVKVVGGSLPWRVGGEVLSTQEGTGRMRHVSIHRHTLWRGCINWSAGPGRGGARGGKDNSFGSIAEPENCHPLPVNAQKHAACSPNT